MGGKSSKKTKEKYEDPVNPPTKSTEKSQKKDGKTHDKADIKAKAKAAKTKPDKEKIKEDSKSPSDSTLLTWLETDIKLLISLSGNVDDALIKESIDEFHTLSVKHVSFINNHWKSAKLSDQDLKKAIKPQETAISSISNLKSKTDNDITKNFIAMVDASAGSFAWFSMNTVSEYKTTIKEHVDASIYYMNKMKMATSGLSQEKQVNYISLGKQFQKVLTRLLDIVTTDYAEPFWSAGGKSSAVKKNSVKSEIKSSKAPVKKLVDKKWIIENQTEFVAIDVTREQRVYVFNCSGDKMKISGKANSITIDGCKNFGFVFDSVISQVEILNSHNVQGQMVESCPSVSIDGSTRISIFISKISAKDIEIFTSRVTDSNFQVDDGDDFKELPIPEQFKTTLNGTIAKTEPVQHT